MVRTMFQVVEKVTAGVTGRWREKGSDAVPAGGVPRLRECPKTRRGLAVHCALCRALAYLAALMLHSFDR